MTELSRLTPLRPARVHSLRLSGKAARRLKELGVLPGAKIRLLGFAPLGGALAFAVQGTIIAVRLDTASQIITESSISPSGGVRP